MRALAITILVAGCGGSGDGDAAADAGPSDASVDARVLSECAPGEFAVGFALDGTLRCDAIDPVATAALASHCSLFFGHSDNCDGCTTLPAKWGRVSGDTCTNGIGLDNTCQSSTLGGVTLPLFGLNTDGTVNDDDKFHLGFECTTPADAPIAGPCPPGSFLTAIAGGETECATGRAAIVDSLAEGCRAYFGWRDSCDGCTSAPSKWGRASSGDCLNGAGLDNTCTSFNLDSTPVDTLGVNTDGTVGADDKFYLGFQCTGATSSEGLTSESCPPGELIVAIEEGGIRCASPVVAAEAAVQDGCFLYFGWRDTCDGCTTDPAKWGRVGHNLCENGTGVNNTCASTPLDGTSIELFGINTDGDVDDNDKFYLGLACP